MKLGVDVQEKFKRSQIDYTGILKKKLYINTIFQYSVCIMWGNDAINNAINNVINDAINKLRFKLP